MTATPKSPRSAQSEVDSKPPQTSDTSDRDEDGATFNLDDRILCYHGPLLYEAKVLKKETWPPGDDGKPGGIHYYVHYRGWKNTWDEWVHHSRAMKYSQENIQTQNSLKEFYKQAEKTAGLALSTSRAASKKQQPLPGSNVLGVSGAQPGFPGKPANSITPAGASNAMSISHRDLKDKEKESMELMEDVLNRLRIRVEVPETLKVRIVRDWELVTKQLKLMVLPRKPTVLGILQQYRSSTTSHLPYLEEVLQGLELYFDKCLSNLLLFPLERQQYADMKQKHPELRPAQLYGCEHLLRLFVQLPILIAHTNMDDEETSLLKDYLHAFLGFVETHEAEFLTAEYEVANVSSPWRGVSHGAMAGATTNVSNPAATAPNTATAATATGDYE